MSHIREHKYSTAWCAQVKFLLRRTGLSQREFADRVHLSEGAVSHYIVGRYRPPVELLDQWADALALRGQEREQFKWLALETYTPSVVWDRVCGLEAQLVHASEKVLGQAKEIDHLAVQVAQLRGMLVKLREKCGAPCAEVR